MLDRNRLKAGDYVVSVPLGIRVTLQYKPAGTLEKVWLGYEVDQTNLTQESKILCSEILKQSKVPSHIGTNNGSVFVQGILYLDKYPKVAGTLESEIQQTLIDFIVTDDEDFNFFAGAAFATSIKFGGALQVRNWLKLQGFNLLPGCLLLTGLQEVMIKKSLEMTPFQYELLIGQFAFKQSGSEYLSLEKTQNTVKDIEIYLDQSGYVRSRIQFADDTMISMSYFEMMTKDLCTDDLVILDDENKVITKYPVPQHVMNHHSYTCPFCGKVYDIEDEFARCPDSHCFSRAYFDINHFLTQLNLPTLEYSRYLELVDSKKLTTFSDILLIDELNSVIIETSFYEILNAIIPIWAVRNRDSIWKLCSSCNNSWESIKYYMDNPTLISTDLDVYDSDLVWWLQDCKNIDTVSEILQYTNIVITADVKKFEGAPIFRGKNIWLTGKFKHGSISEVESILRSYSASITQAEEADCGIIGDIPEGVDGSKVNMLKNKRIPVFNESEFFNKYQIDADLN